MYKPKKGGGLYVRKSSKSEGKKIVVLYHAECSDGFGGAFAAWKKFGKKAEYFPLYHDRPPLDLKDRKIIFVDFTYPENTMKKLIKNNNVDVIDHHVTSRRAASLAQTHVYSDKQSGSVLAWRHFFPDRPTPKLFRYIEDFDLWKFKLPHTKEISAYIDAVDYDFKIWGRLVGNFENVKKLSEYIRKGGIILDYESKTVRNLIETKSVSVRFEGLKTLAVNSPLYNSQLGDALRKKCPPIGIVWFENGAHKKISLRSNGKVDVSKLAQKYGGGGHKTSAGFALPLDAALPWKRLSSSSYEATKKYENTKKSL